MHHRLYFSEITLEYRHAKTVGVVRLDQSTGAAEVFEPIGAILAITPVTNPTSTAIFKVRPISLALFHTFDRD